MASFDQAIPPGQVGKVTASMKTENYRGQVEKSITVTTDDPTKSVVNLRIKANVVGSIVILPRPGLAFPTGLSWDYSGKLIVRKDETETGELKVTDVTSTASWLQVRARRVDTSEPAAEGIPATMPGDYVLDVSVADDAPKTQGGFTLKFKTGLPREPEATIPVSVILQNPMRVSPSPLFLQPPTDPAKETTGVLTATLRPGLSKETLKATASPEAFSVKVDPDGPRRYRATVSWKPNGTDAPKEGSVVFRVGEESLTVLVRVADPKAAFVRSPMRPAGAPAASPSPSP